MSKFDLNSFIGTPDVMKNAVQNIDMNKLVPYKIIALSSMRAKGLMIWLGAFSCTVSWCRLLCVPYPTVINTKYYADITE